MISVQDQEGEGQWAAFWQLAKTWSFQDLTFDAPSPDPCAARGPLFGVEQTPRASWWVLELDSLLHGLSWGPSSKDSGSKEGHLEGNSPGGVLSRRSRVRNKQACATWSIGGVLQPGGSVTPKPAGSPQLLQRQRPSVLSPEWSVSVGRIWQLGSHCIEARATRGGGGHC